MDRVSRVLVLVLLTLKFSLGLPHVCQVTSLFWAPSGSDFLNQIGIIAVYKPKIENERRQVEKVFLKFRTKLNRFK